MRYMFPSGSFEPWVKFTLRFLEIKATITGGPNIAKAKPLGVSLHLVLQPNPLGPGAERGPRVGTQTSSLDCLQQLTGALGTAEPFP